MYICLSTCRDIFGGCIPTDRINCSKDRYILKVGRYSQNRVYALNRTCERSLHDIFLPPLASFPSL